MIIMRISRVTNGDGDSLTVFFKVVWLHIPMTGQAPGVQMGQEEKGVAGTGIVRDGSCLFVCNCKMYIVCIKCKYCNN